MRRIELHWEDDGEGAHGWIGTTSDGKRYYLGDDVPDADLTQGLKTAALLDALEQIQDGKAGIVDQIIIHWGLR